MRLRPRKTVAPTSTLTREKSHASTSLNSSVYEDFPGPEEDRNIIKTPRAKTENIEGSRDADIAADESDDSSVLSIGLLARSKAKCFGSTVTRQARRRRPTTGAITSRPSFASINVNSSTTAPSDTKRRMHRYKFCTGNSKKQPTSRQPKRAKAGKKSASQTKLTSVARRTELRDEKVTPQLYFGFKELEDDNNIEHDEKKAEIADGNNNNADDAESEEGDNSSLFLRSLNRGFGALQVVSRAVSVNDSADDADVVDDVQMQSVHKKTDGDVEQNYVTALPSLPADGDEADEAVVKAHARARAAEQRRLERKASKETAKRPLPLPTVAPKVRKNAVAAFFRGLLTVNTANEDIAVPPVKPPRVLVSYQTKVSTPFKAGSISVATSSCTTTTISQSSQGLRKLSRLAAADLFNAGNAAAGEAHELPPLKKSLFLADAILDDYPDVAETAAFSNEDADTGQDVQSVARAANVGEENLLDTGKEAIFADAATGFDGGDLSLLNDRTTVDSRASHNDAPPPPSHDARPQLPLPLANNKSFRRRSCITQKPHSTPIANPLGGSAILTLDISPIQHVSPVATSAPAHLSNHNNFAPSVFGFSPPPRQVIGGNKHRPVQFPYDIPNVQEAPWPDNKRGKAALTQPQSDIPIYDDLSGANGNLDERNMRHQFARRPIGACNDRNNNNNNNLARKVQTQQAYAAAVRSVEQVPVVASDNNSNNNFMPKSALRRPRGQTTAIDLEDLALGVDYELTELYRSKKRRLNDVRDTRNFVICSTGVSVPKQLAEIKRFVRDVLHARYDKNLTSATTHLIVMCDDKGECPRTLKYLQCIAQQKYCMSFAWVEAALKHGDNVNDHDDAEWLDEFRFLARGGNTMTRDAPSDAPRRAVALDAKPLVDVVAYFGVHAPDDAKNDADWNREMVFGITRKHYVALLSDMGAQVVLDFKQFVAMSSRSTARRFEYVWIVQSYSDIDASRCRLLGARAHYVDMSWLLECISSYALLPYETYRPIPDDEAVDGQTFDMDEGLGTSHTGDQRV